MTPCVEHPTYGSRVRKPGSRPVVGSRRAYVVAWEATHGPVPEGRILHHTCENEWCVSVDHLECITQSEHAAAHLAERNKRKAAERTHCKNGHPLEGDNLRWVISGRDGRYRRCFTCLTAAKRKYETTCKSQ